jgi:hypothetical protein
MHMPQNMFIHILIFTHTPLPCSHIEYLLTHDTLPDHTFPHDYLLIVQSLSHQTLRISRSHSPHLNATLTYSADQQHNHIRHCPLLDLISSRRVVRNPVRFSSGYSCCNDFRPVFRSIPRRSSALSWNIIMHSVSS